MKSHLKKGKSRRGVLTPEYHGGPRPSGWRPRSCRTWAGLISRFDRPFNGESLTPKPPVLDLAALASNAAHDRRKQRGIIGNINAFPARFARKEHRERSAYWQKLPYAGRFPFSNASRCVIKTPSFVLPYQRVPGQ